MPPVTVTHFVTDDGKVQIDVTNVSGRPQPLSRDRTTAAGELADRQGEVKDQDEPCSLIVSLRASHPQFFFYRGPQPKQATSNIVASPLRALNGGGGGGGGGTGRHHRRSGSALWGHEVVDPAILDVSRQSWKEHNFLPVAPDTCSSSNTHDRHRSGDAAANGNGKERGNTHLQTLSDNGGGANVIADDRPLLVREEMADCVLLPGERRTFVIEVSNPSVLARLMAQRKQAPSRSGGKANPHNASSGQARLPPVTHHSNGSDRDDDNYQKRLLRDQTDVFHTDSSAHGFSAHPNSGRAPPPNASGSLRSDGTPPGFDKTLPGKLSVERLGGFQHQHSWDDQTDTDGHGRSSSRQPLSIVGDSATTRGSAEVARNSLTHNPQQRQQRASGGPDSLRSSGDYVVPPMTSSSNSSRTFNNDASSTNNNNNNNNDHHAAGLLPSSAGANHYSPPSLSHFPVFYVYYCPLGDENKCVDRARKWIAKEQHAYHEWREGLVKHVVDHERKREHTWSTTADNLVVPPQPRLEVKRILPPVLGELVRWRNDDGSSWCDGDPMELSPVTVAAYHYYFTRWSAGAGAGGGSHARTSTAGSNPSGPVRSISMLSSRLSTAPEVPQSFAASRTNRVSKKAKKMFAGERMGAGTVVMPLRVSSEVEARSGGRRNSATFSGNTPIKVPSSHMAGGGSRPPALQPQQQQQRGTSQFSRASETSTNATPTPQPSLPNYGPSNASRLGGDDDETDFYAGSVSPSESGVRDSGSYARRPRLHTGRGLALLDDSVTGPLSPSAYGTSEAALSSGDYPTEVKQSFLAVSTNSNSRWGRTETLDPEAAELAARNPPPHRDAGALLSSSLKEHRPSLPSFPSTLDGSRHTTGSGEHGSGNGMVNSPELISTPFSAAGRQLRNSNSSSHLNGQLSDDLLPPAESSPGAATAGGAVDSPEAEAEDNHPGSFVAHLIQSFCGLAGGKAENTSQLEGGEEDALSPHVRDISSAPPQRVTYRRRNNAGNASFNGGGLNGSTNGSLIASHSQAKFNRLVDQSKVAKGQMRDLAQQLAELTGTAAVQLGGFLQEHGPTAAEGFMTALNFIKDNVLTPETVKMMETVITPMVVVFSVVTLLYLLVFGGGGAGEALPLLYSGGL